MSRQVVEHEGHPFEIGTIYIWTDGACAGNPGQGGWAARLESLWEEDGKLWWGMREFWAGVPGPTTNNRMELNAAVVGLSELRRDNATVVLYSDSKYLVDGCQQWLADWKERGWQKSDGEPIKNLDLWMHIDALLEKHDVTVKWIKGHDGDPRNEKVDHLASWHAQIKNSRRFKTKQGYDKSHKKAEVG